MNDETLRAALETSTRSVLEDAAFIFTEPGSEPISETSWPESVIRAQLSFSGSVDGHFVIAASPQMCLGLASDMLGVDPGEPEARSNAVGALQEILNMVAGMTLKQALGNEGFWELGVPQATSMSPSEYVSGPRSDICVHLDTDEEEPVEVGVFLHEGAS